MSTVATTGAPTSGVLGRGAWVLTSQVVSSLTNMVLGLAALRYGGPIDFGSYAAAFLVFQIAISLTRAAVSEPFLVDLGGRAARGRRWQEQVLHGAAAAGGVGVAVGSIAIVGGLLLGGPARGALVVTGLVLPGLTIQDFCRLAFVGLWRPKLSAASDGLWLLLQVGGLALLIASDQTSVVELIATWGVCGLLAGAIAYSWVRNGTDRRHGSSRAWFSEHRRMSTHLTAELALASGGQYLALAVVGVVSGLVTLGSVRAAFLMVAPVQLFYQAAQAFVIPELGRAREVGHQRFRRGVVELAGSLAAVVIAWLVVVLVTPSTVGEALFHDGWQAARPLLPGIAVLMLGESAVVSSRVVLRVLGRSDRSLAARALMSPLVVTGACVGALSHGAVGAIWGLAVAQVIGAVVWWLQLSALGEWGGVGHRGRPMPVARSAEEFSRGS